MKSASFQKNAFYIKNLLNSDLNPILEHSLLENLTSDFKSLFDADIGPFMVSLPEDTSDTTKINILRDILNGKEQCRLENISPESATLLQEIKSKVSIVDITNYDFDKNLSLIFDVFDLDQDYRDLVQCMLSMYKNTMMRNILDCFDITVMSRIISEEHIPFFSAMCTIPRQQIKKMLSENSILFESNILVQKMGDTKFNESFMKLTFKKHQSVDEVRNTIVGEPISCDLNAGNFIHIADAFNNVKTLLQKSRAAKKRGINILVHGAVGCGKTSFAQAVATDAGLRLYSACGTDLDTDARRAKLNQMQKILTSDSGAVLLFDDAEDLLGQDTRCNDRLAVHKILENNTTPVIWVVHSIHDIPNSCLRRFSLTASVSTPDEKIRKDVWAGVFKRHNIDFDYDKLSKDIKVMDVPLAILDNAVRNAEITENPDMVSYTLNSYISTLNGNKKEPPKAEPDTFNTNLLNTDTDLKMLADRIANKKLHKFSLCLYGAPGTGKTAFASYLAHALDMPIVKKPASDLKGSYVGETEKNIARAFDEARVKHALLVFDEADSFLQDRNKAQRSWEVSSVNEMLTQMEKADFPFICTTNLMDSLDAASLRRFTFKVKYDFLTPHQVVLAFNEFFGKNIDDTDVKKCTNLAPGDFVVVKNKAEILDITDTQELLDMLLQEQSVKSHNTQKIGF